MGTFSSKSCFRCNCGHDINVTSESQNKPDLRRKKRINCIFVSSSHFGLSYKWLVKYYFSRPKATFGWVIFMGRWLNFCNILSFIFVYTFWLIDPRPYNIFLKHRFSLEQSKHFLHVPRQRTFYTFYFWWYKLFNWWL